MTRKEQGLAEIDAAGVRPGQRWQHWKGTTYTVVATGLDEATTYPVVVYGGHDGVVWTRPLHVFLEEVSPGVARFTPLRVDEPSPVRGGRYL